MSDTPELHATARGDLGKGASRRLRRDSNLIPAIIYGAGKDPQPLSIVSKDIERALEQESFYSQVIAVNVDGDIQKAILRDLQRHPAKNRVMHADFLRIDENVAIKVNVPIHFINEEKSRGVKGEGGIVEHQANEIEVLCLPGDIPEYIEVDMLEVGLGDIVHLSDVLLPEGVASVALALGEDHDMAIASIVAPRAAVVSDEEEVEAVEDAADEEAAEDDDED